MFSFFKKLIKPKITKKIITGYVFGNDFGTLVNIGHYAATFGIM
jgi:hypothetical protein